MLPTLLKKNVAPASNTQQNHLAYKLPPLVHLQSTTTDIDFPTTYLFKISITYCILHLIHISLRDSTFLYPSALSRHRCRCPKSTGYRQLFNLQNIDVYIPISTKFYAKPIYITYHYSLLKYQNPFFPILHFLHIFHLHTYRTWRSCQSLYSTSNKSNLSKVKANEPKKKIQFQNFSIFKF